MSAVWREQVVLLAGTIPAVLSRVVLVIRIGGYYGRLYHFRLVTLTGELGSKVAQIRAKRGSQIGVSGVYGDIDRARPVYYAHGSGGLILAGEL